jgi:hypothetical protein
MTITDLRHLAEFIENRDIAVNELLLRVKSQSASRFRSVSGATIVEESEGVADL